MPTRVIGASVPPQNITSARPSRIASRSVSYRHVRGGARSRLGGERPSCPELHRDPRRRHVRDDLDDREGARPVRTALEEGLEAVLEGVEPSDAGGAGGAHAVWLCRDREPAVGLRHSSRRERELRETIHAARLLALDPRGRLELLRLAGEAHRVLARVEVRDRARAGLPRDEALPGRFRIVAERRHHPHSGDDDPAPAVLGCVAHLALHPQSAVDEQHRARDERGVLRAEKPNRPRHVLRIAEAA